MGFSEYTGGLSTLDYSVMAKISDGYTIGAIDSCLKEVLTCKRKLQLRTQPLTHAEIINTLSMRDPVYREEEEAFDNWWSKTPLGRRYERALEMEEEARFHLSLKMNSLLPLLQFISFMNKLNALLSRITAFIADSRVSKYSFSTETLSPRHHKKLM